MNFDQAFIRLVDPQHEGGYVNDPQDPGGETRYGISKRAYPNEDIANLTMERAKFLYMRDYWIPACCDVVPDAIKFDLFDLAVNSGPHEAKVLLQATAQVPQDGQIGPVTLQALNSMNPAVLSARLSAKRLLFMTDLPNWPHEGRGWARRIANNLLTA